MKAKCYVVVYHNNSAWTDIVARFKIDAVEFIKGHSGDIFSDIKNCAFITEVRYNLFCSLFSFLNLMRFIMLWQFIKK